MIKEGTAGGKEKGTDGAIKWYKVWQTWGAWRGDRGSRAEWMLPRRREEEEWRGEGEVKGRGMNELYHITCNSQQWLRNLKIQGFINHLVWQREHCISESYCRLLAVLTGACQTRAEANRSHTSFPLPLVFNIHICASLALWQGHISDT